VCLRWEIYYDRYYIYLLITSHTGDYHSRQRTCRWHVDCLATEENWHSGCHFHSLGMHDERMQINEKKNTCVSQWLSRFISITCVFWTVVNSDKCGNTLARSEHWLGHEWEGGRTHFSVPSYRMTHVQRPIWGIHVAPWVLPRHLQIAGSECFSYSHHSHQLRCCFCCCSGSSDCQYSTCIQIPDLSLPLLKGRLVSECVWFNVPLDT